MSCRDGVATEEAVFRLVRLPRSDETQNIFLISLPNNGAYVGPALSLVPIEAAQGFEVQSGPDGPVYFRFEAQDKYLVVGGDGSVTTGGERCMFTMCPQPLMGSVTVAHALNSMNGRNVSIWGGPDLGWVCPHPTNFFGGGEVKCRVPRMGVWEQFTLQVLDAASGRVALRSVHDRWLCAHADGNAWCDKKAVGGWEQWQLRQVDPTAVALVSQAHHGGAPKFLSAAQERMDVRSDGPGAAQRFVLFDTDEARKRYNQTNPAFKVPSERAQLSPLAIAGIVSGVLLGAGAIAGGVAAAVIAVERAQQRENAEREQAALARAAAEKATAEAEAARLAAEDANARVEAQAAARSAIAALREQTGDASAVSVACMALSEVTTSFVSARQTAVNGGGPAAIAAGMARHAGNAGVAAAGIAALTSLATTSAANLACVGGGAVDAVLGALRTHAASPDVVPPGLRLLGSLCSVKEGQDASASAGAIAAVTGAMRAHASSASLQRQGMETLLAMFDHHEKGITAFIQPAAGGLDAVSTTLGNHNQDAEAVRSALAAVTEVCRWTHGAAAVAKGGVAAAVVRALTSAVSEKDDGVARLAALCIGYYMCWETVWPSTKAALLGAAAPAAVSKAIQWHTDSHSFQRSCCLALARFVAYPEALEACRAAIPAVAAAMRAYRGDKQVDDACTTLFMAFVSHQPARRAVCDAVPPIYRKMLQALGPLPGDTDALLKAAFDGDAYEARELLDRQVSTRNRERKTAASLPGGVRHFSSTTPWVGTALHVAARHGRTEIMELLLERGADVNEEASFTPYSGGDFGVCGSPLCAAVFGKQAAAVTLLLDNDATVDDQALALAAGNEEIATLLRAQR